MSSRKPCDFHNKPGGCRKGQKCHFAHIGPTRAAASTSSSTSSPRPAKPPGKAPPGVCKHFLAGKCNRGAGCNFRHEANPNGAASRASAAGPSTPFDAGFLTEAGLAKVMEAGSDVFFPPTSSDQRRTPIQVQNPLQRVLAEDYRFNGTLQMYSFLGLLTSANSSDPEWTSEQGQLLLNKITTANGLARISDIVRYQPVSLAAGSSKDKLSFQRGYVPILQYLSSEFVVKSNLHHSVNALYTIILNHLPYFANVVEASIDAAMKKRDFKDSSTGYSAALTPISVLYALTEVLFECITRFKDALVTHTQIPKLIFRVREWTDTWIAGINSNPPTFQDPFKIIPSQSREHFLTYFKNKVTRIGSIAQAKLNKAVQPQTDLALTHGRRSLSEVADLDFTYDGPGIQRRNGPRHDNDDLDFVNVRIAPTHQELICRTAPFLPGNFYGAPHPLPAGSMERILDIQYRLLREELTAPIRSSVQLVFDDLLTRGHTQLDDLLRQRGGRYRHDSAMFNVYTNVTFTTFVPGSRDLSAGLMFDAPPGAARMPQGRARAAFWEKGKRLMQGGLIALAWRSGGDVTVHLGVLTSSQRDIVNSARQGSSERIGANVAFFDPAVEMRILHSLRDSQAGFRDTRVLIEAPVMFESVRPFLEALQCAEPESIPFSRYIVHQPAENLERTSISPPAYATVPGWSFQLASLFPKEAAIDDLKMSVNDPASVENARKHLRESSRLDPSQADAVVSALTRELALIQGPPGTGKSYTGVELLRVLIKNRVRPILMIALTNHALDHLLSACLDAGITGNIARLGSRSSDERISKYNLEEMVRAAGYRSPLDRALSDNHRELKRTESEIINLMKAYRQKNVTSQQIITHLQVNNPEWHEGLCNPPSWIVALRALENQEDGDGEWKTAGSDGRTQKADKSLYAYWQMSADLTFLARPPPRSPQPAARPGVAQSSARAQNQYDILSTVDNQPSIPGDDEDDDDEDDSDEDDDVNETHALEGIWRDTLERHRNESSDDDDSENEEYETPTSSMSSTPAPEPPRSPDILDLQDPIAFFAYMKHDTLPVIPTSDRSLDQLIQEQPNIWSLSRVERTKLHRHLDRQVRSPLYETQLEEFERLRVRHAKAVERNNEARNETRRQLLTGVDIIGATTTGAAKLTSLLSSIGPRVMLVEEAGQVLETHVLGTLARATQHCILIGDPLQLRPTLNNYSLSMDNARGRELYRFDMSLMERLSKDGFPMAHIDVQRRMRPSISHLIRSTLYPTLEDHDLVKSYPDVRGFAKNVFFFTHNHRECGGGEESSSKYNVFEVDMIKDLVLYLLRQGTYTQEGDIVVLCGYLGQLARVRDALAACEITALLDERDQVELADKEEDKEDVNETVKVSKQVRIRTIDNYQGEEAKIIILSLVRNSGNPEGEAGIPAARPNIGFLKSENRTNVALSRAKHGLFILGNAQNLTSRSLMWRKVIEELEKDGSVGEAFPVICNQHPDNAQLITEPGQLPRVAPDGGCMRPCGTTLKCGHPCPYKCHADDPQHVGVTCIQRCARLCPRGHPCPGVCAERCADCRFSLADVVLPCGHVKSSVPCPLYESLETVRCDVMVTRALPNCEHRAQMRCSDDVARFACNVVVTRTLPDCEHNAQMRCSDDVARFACNVMVTRALPDCEHNAQMRCSDDAAQFACTQPCREVMACCNKSCSAPCAECQRETRKDVAAHELPHKRTKHKAHGCQKSLFCCHPCQSPCSEDHECTSNCTEPCRQVCSHGRCDKPCGSPCAPCQKACEWKCPHYSCPLPCGSVCARLPCDERCTNELPCGHQCPSVCGEDCRNQKCPACASARQKAQVVDLISTRFADIRPDFSTLDNLVITLPSCGHTFTVKTLDEICALHDYYRRHLDGDGTQPGRWRSLATPPRGFILPPLCPTCHTAITARRYGRVFKRANLDVLERNTASHMSRALGGVHGLLSSTLRPALVTSLTTGAKTVRIEKKMPSANEKKRRQKNRNTLLKDERVEPCPPQAFDIGNNYYHSAPPADVQAWKRVTQKLLDAYEKAADIAQTRPAHAHAWEATFASLTSAAFPAHPGQSAADMEGRVMRAAATVVGQAQPRADSRFRVEALWATIQIRLLLSDLAMVWLGELVKKAKNSFPHHCATWADYVSFILKTCLKDADLALDIARQSESYRQIVTTSLLIQRTRLEHFRFDIFMIRQTGHITQHRDSLLQIIQQQTEDTRREMISTVEAYRNARVHDDVELEWLSTNFIQPSKIILRAWEASESYVRAGRVYELQPFEEMSIITNALHFSQPGEWYQCPEGHSYANAECDGQPTRCPECGLLKKSG